MTAPAMPPLMVVVEIQTPSRTYLYVDPMNFPSVDLPPLFEVQMDSTVYRVQRWVGGDKVLKNGTLEIFYRQASADSRITAVETVDPNVYRYVCPQKT